MVKKTKGQIIQEHNDKGYTLDDDVVEYRRTMEPGIISQLRETIDKVRHQDTYKNKDFYVVLLITIDRIMGHPKFVFLARQSCPTPVYKQSVWKYKHTSGEIEFLWSIPDKLRYADILNNQIEYITNPETAVLARFVILMENGELLRWVKKENGEKEDAVITIKKEDNTCLMN
jgi:hypothetical protein